MYEEIKRNNIDSIVIIKQGIFYITYGVDAEILNYLFNFKLKEINNKIKVGFPNIDKVIEKLNKLKINYIVLNKKKTFKNNNYNNIVKVIKIVKKLNKLDSNLIDKIESII